MTNTTPTRPDTDLVPEGEAVTLPAAQVRAVKRHLRKAGRIMDSWSDENWMRGMGALWTHVSEADGIVREWPDD